MTAEIEGDFVVFMIGARINKWWMFHKWIPFIMAMPKMLTELSKNQDSGCLGFDGYGMFRGVIIQYWRSFEHLEKYARNPDREHFPAWVNFNKNINASNAVGIWHETYLVKAGNYECIYNHMPPRGLGRVTKLVPATHKKDTAAQRAGVREVDEFKAE